MSEKHLELTLSASKLKTYLGCSVKYDFQYRKLIPQPKTSALIIGDIVHIILECLAVPRHIELYNKILKDNTTKKCKSITRYIDYRVKKDNLTKENRDKIDFCVASGVSTKLLKGDGKLIGVEVSFDWKDAESLYRAKGFMDLAFDFYDKFVRIVDYKTSVKVFSGKDLEENVQALLYGLIASKLYPNRKIVVDFYFLFLKEWQRFEINKEQLAGFEIYFSQLYDQINNFTDKDIMSNVAAYQGFPTDGSFSKKLLCGFAKAPNIMKKDGSGLQFFCSFKFPFDYYGLYQGDKLIKTSLKKEDLKPEKGEKVRKLNHQGCPAFNKR